MAADYISREAAMDAVDVCNLHRGIIDALQAIISDIPSADVVEVCRCAECAKAIRMKIVDGELVYWCTANFICRCQDDYCSRGERGSDHGTEIP